MEEFSVPATVGVYWKHRFTFPELFKATSVEAFRVIAANVGTVLLLAQLYQYHPG